MSVRKKLLGALSLALMAAGMHLPANAETLESQTLSVEDTSGLQLESLPTQGLLEADASSPDLAITEVSEPTYLQLESLQTENLQAENLQTESLQAESLPSENLETAALDASELEAVELDVDESSEIAQARRRTRNRVARSGSDFVGIGADFGYVDSVSFAVISKLSLSEQIALRPSVLVGDDLAVLVPVTYEFTRFSTDVSGFQIRPYAGVGASYDGDGEDFNLLLAAGADAPLSQRFTLNAQANLGVFNDTDFGVTVGVGYNFGSLLGR